MHTVLDHTIQTILHHPVHTILQESYVVTFFVMAIAAMAYFAKVTNMGEATIKGRTPRQS